MLTRDYIANLVSSLDSIADSETQVLEANGYDAVMAIVESIRKTSFPVIVVEDQNSGYFTVDGATLDSYTQSIWFLDQVPTDQGDRSRTAVLASTLALMKTVLALIIADGSDDSPSGLQMGRMYYNKRSGGPNCWGYELSLTFVDDISLLPA